LAVWVLGMENVLSDKDVLRAAPPQSVSTVWTVAATLFGVALGCAIIFWFRPDMEVRLAALTLMACVFVLGAFAEMFLNLAPEKSGLDFTWRSLSVARVFRKIVALWSIFAVLAVGYAALPEYTAEFYKPVHWLLNNLGWLLVMASVPYVAAVDAFQAEPEDTLWSIGNKLLSLSFRFSPQEINYLLGWLVKAFFLPLMFAYLIIDINSWREFKLTEFTFDVFYETSYKTLFFVDLVVAVVGYTATLRILGTEIRSAEPTLLGWSVALICYEPFSNMLGRSYISFGGDFIWKDWLNGYPVISIIWGTAILALLFVYCWATVVFGIRFSNLTNRGIITSGPYRWTKHPAYICKNLTWWMINLPFLPADGSLATSARLCLMIGLCNFVYFMRAKTEEWHLSRDPDYRAYSDYIRQHGLFRFLPG
jgi:protein-S-isoprenylcysteine O-methyltransferase Ste14